MDMFEQKHAEPGVTCVSDAGVSALTTCKLWEIERQIFQGIVIKIELMKRQHYTILLQGYNFFLPLIKGKDKGHLICEATSSLDI